MCSPEQSCSKVTLPTSKILLLFGDFLAGVTAIDFLSSKHSVSMYLENYNLPSVHSVFIIIFYLQLLSYVCWRQTRNVYILRRLTLATSCNTATSLWTAACIFYYTSQRLASTINYLQAFRPLNNFF